MQLFAPATSAVDSPLLALLLACRMAPLLILTLTCHHIPRGTALTVPPLSMLADLPVALAMQNVEASWWKKALLKSRCTWSWQMPPDLAGGQNLQMARDLARPQLYVLAVIPFAFAGWAVLEPAPEALSHNPLQPGCFEHLTAR